MRIEKIYLRITDNMLGYELDTGEFAFDFFEGFMLMNSFAATISGNQRLHTRWVTNTGHEYWRHTFEPLDLSNEQDWLKYIERLELVEMYQLQVWLHS